MPGPEIMIDITLNYFMNQSGANNLRNMSICEYHFITWQFLDDFVFLKEKNRVEIYEIFCLSFQYCFFLLALFIRYNFFHNTYTTFFHLLRWVLFYLPLFWYKIMWKSTFHFFLKNLLYRWAYFHLSLFNGTLWRN